MLFSGDDRMHIIRLTPKTYPLIKNKRSTILSKMKLVVLTPYVFIKL